MAKSKLNYMDYPEGWSRRRSGCKVAWLTYATKPQAEKAAIAARHNGAIQEHLGFDFGYQAPARSTPSSTVGR